MIQAQPSLTVNRTTEAAYSTSTSPGALDPDSPQSDNPIGRLQEMAMKNNWALPIYNQLVLEQRMEHVKNFVYECKVSDTGEND